MHKNKRICIVLTNVHKNVLRTVNPLLAYYILSTQIYRLIYIHNTHIYIWLVKKATESALLLGELDIQ